MVNRWKEEMLEGDAAEKFVPGGYEDGEVSQDEYAAITAGSVSESKMAKERDSAEIYVMDADGRRATSSLRENVTNLNESAKLDTELAVVKEASSTREQSDGQLQAQALEVRKAAFRGKVPAIAEAVQTVKYQEKVWEPSSRMEESSGSRERLNAFQHFVVDKKRSLELPMQMRESKRLHGVAETKKIMDAHIMDEDNLGAKPRRRGRRSTDESTLERPKSTEFAAITPKNIVLMYLRRALLLDLLDDPEFNNKVIGTFVRIRIPGISSKTEIIYTLVLVTGTRIGKENYQAGTTKTTNIVLEIVNLQKKVDVRIDMVSNQDFTDEECQGLRQIIKCGFIKPLTVGQVEEKAIVLRGDNLNHWFESEEHRMINLRDRASENGREKELRECVEKLKELRDPAFRAAKLQAMPEVTSDPHMDPGYESDSNDLQRKLSPNDGGRRGENLGAGGDSALRMHGKYQSRDQNRIRDVDSNSGGNGGRIDVSAWADDSNFPPAQTKAQTKAAGYTRVGDPWADDSNFRGGEGKAVFEDPRADNSNFRRGQVKAPGSTPVFGQVTGRQVGREVVSSGTQASGWDLRSQIVVMSETEKMWLYQDPEGMVQGPFSMEQLRNWSTRELFPLNLTIWKTGDLKKNSEVLLTDALADSDMLVASPKGVDVCRRGDGGSRKSRYGRSRSGHEYDAPVARDGSLSGSARGRVRKRKDVPQCRHYAKGFCERGDDCKFRHE